MKSLRNLKIVDYVKSRHYCSMEELQEHFHVSPATIYRDIQSLVSRGALQRIRGGVEFVERREGRTALSSPFQDRQEWNRTQKQDIARQALLEICEGDIIFLDSSTTVSVLAELLESAPLSNLTIVTNSATVIGSFHRFPPQFILIGLGGTYDPQLNAFLGKATITQLESLSITKVFMSAYGIDDNLVTTNHENHAGLLQKVIAMAEHRYLLADKSKYNRRGLHRVASTHVFDKIIT